MHSPFLPSGSNRGPIRGELVSFAEQEQGAAHSGWGMSLIKSLWNWLYFVNTLWILESQTSRANIRELVWRALNSSAVGNNWLHWGTLLATNQTVWQCEIAKHNRWLWVHFPEDFAQWLSYPCQGMRSSQRGCVFGSVNVLLAFRAWMCLWQSCDSHA